MLALALLLSTSTTAAIAADWPPAFQNIDRVGPDATPESRARRRFLRHAFGRIDLDLIPELLPFCHFSLYGTPENPNPPYRARFLALNCKIDGHWTILTW
jgi:hypothetical protein